MSVSILVIDLQNDFVKSTGNLPVSGAEADAARIATFIRKNTSRIDHITVTLDSHHAIHIAHPAYWRDSNGNAPAPFTGITAQSVREGRWTATIDPAGALRYLVALEKTGKTHTIWNPHCIIGTEGWALYKPFSDALIEWELATQTPVNAELKGYNCATEHYSIFRAEVELPDAPETALNRRLLDTLNRYDRLFLVGEAADFCVANSLNDIVNEAPALAKKVTVLDDAMSWIIAGNPAAKNIYDNAVKAGVRIKKSTDTDLFL
jgi:nicotinamidase-related amidase